MKANLYDEEEEIDELTKPIKAVEEKWKLLPHFLRMRGLMRQHIDSFNHFVNVDIKQIVAARSNCEVRSEADPKFFLRYTDIYVGEPNLEEEAFVTSNGKNESSIAETTTDLLYQLFLVSCNQNFCCNNLQFDLTIIEIILFCLTLVTPFQCRLRDCTYSAPLYVNVRYTRQRQIVTKNGIQIGRIPIMLQSEHCILTGTFSLT
jgi:DNA-directed RNA polymerase III subunit RPC2